MLKSLASSFALVLASATFAHANPIGNLSANSSLSPVPTTSVGSNITTVADSGYRTLNAATFSVGYSETVFMDPNNPLGGLTFSYNFNNIGANPTDLIESVTMANYDGFQVSAFSGTKTDNGATDVAPSSVSRTSNTGNTLSNVKFFFNGGLQAGQDSDYLILETDANSYTAGSFTFQDGSTTEDLNVFAPAETTVTPEPSSLILFGTGFLGAAGAARRKFSV